MTRIDSHTGGIELTPSYGPLTESEAARVRRETLRELGVFAASLPDDALEKLLTHAVRLYNETVAGGATIPEGEADA